MIQIFGTVCYDRVRIIDEFPKLIGSYTNVSSEQILLGGEASNTFICLIRWLIESNDKNKNLIKLIAEPIKKDGNGEIVLKILNPYSDNIVYTKIIEKEEDNEILKSSPGADIYVCLKEKERTMFGIGFVEAEILMYNIKDKILNECLKFGKDHWITLDVNTPMMSNEIIKKAIQTQTNLYIMDQEINIVINELINQSEEMNQLVSNNVKSLSLIFQSSSDHFGNKNGDIPTFLNLINHWLSSNNGLNKNFLFILTDSKNGFGVGGTYRNHITGESKWIEPYWFTPIQLPSDKIVDSTGAGDCFRAGMIYSLIHLNQSLNDSLIFASASGGLNCFNYGGNSKTPSLLEINNLIQK